MSTAEYANLMVRCQRWIKRSMDGFVVRLVSRYQESNTDRLRLVGSFTAAGSGFGNRSTADSLPHHPPSNLGAVPDIQHNAASCQER